VGQSATQRQSLYHDIDCAGLGVANGGVLGFSSRVTDVQFADGTFGKVYDVFAFKTQKGKNIAMNLDAELTRKLRSISAEIQNADPSALVVTQRDFTQLATHPAGGALERAYLK
jgi:hypothetical protein